jgi:electron transport complex protein RnfB
MEEPVMETDPYKRLAEQLDALPNGFPATKDGSELRLLARLFTPEEAALAAQLCPTLETVEQIGLRTGRKTEELRIQLKGMSRRGLIAAGRVEGALGFGLMPFVVGIYEMQAGSLDAELASLFEDYFQHGFGETLRIKPQVHRVIPVFESIRNTMEVRPYESAADLVDGAQSWGVLDCICRKQKALIGQPCEHPVDVCMILDQRPDAFTGGGAVHPVSREEALATLQRAAEAGLVHSVSNNQQGVSYICNCCTCSCGVLRGMVELGIANVVASSAFINQVDETICNGCEDCLDACQFNALAMDGGVVQVSAVRCVGCGVCVLDCSTGALGLVRRPEEEIMQIPETVTQWRAARAAARGLDTRE